MGEVSLSPASTFPRGDQPGEAAMHFVDDRVIIHPARQPRLGRLGEDRPPHGKALHAIGAARRRERPAKIRFRRLHPEHDDAAAIRVALGDRGVNGLPCFRARLRFELPPIRLDADRVEPAHDRGDGVGAERAMRPGDDLDEIFAAYGARRVMQGEQPVLLGLPEVGGIVRMVEAQAFDRVRHRPFDEMRAEIGARLELERA